jgi:hypothetical protein
VGKDNAGIIHSLEREIGTARKTLARCEPFGATPLEVKRGIEQLQGQLATNRMVVTIATDGLPTDDNGSTGGKADAELERTFGHDVQHAARVHYDSIVHGR